MFSCYLHHWLSNVLTHVCLCVCLFFYLILIFYQTNLENYAGFFWNLGNRQIMEQRKVDWSLEVINYRFALELTLRHTLFTTNDFSLAWQTYALCWPLRGAGVPPFRLCSSLVHSLPHLLLFITFLFFSHPLYLFSSIVHPIPFYQNSPTPFPGVRS